MKGVMFSINQMIKLNINDFKRDFFIGTENYFKSCLSIPIYPELDDKKLKYIINVIKKIILRSKKH